MSSDGPRPVRSSEIQSIRRTLRTANALENSHVVACAERVIAAVRHRLRTSFDTRTPPSKTPGRRDKEDFKALLECLHLPPVRDRVGAIDVLAEVAHFSACADFEKTVSGCFTRGVRLASRPVPQTARIHAAAACLRDDVFSFGLRLHLAHIGLPESISTARELMETTKFEGGADSTDTLFQLLLRALARVLPDAQWSLDAFAEVYECFIHRCSDAQIEHHLDLLTGEETHLSWLLALCARQACRPYHRALLRTAERLKVDGVDALMEYLIVEGHPSATQAAVQCLVEHGCQESRPALAKLENVFHLPVVSLAADVSRILEHRPPKAPRARKAMLGWLDGAGDPNEWSFTERWLLYECQTNRDAQGVNLDARFEALAVCARAHLAQASEDRGRAATTHLLSVVDLLDDVTPMPPHLAQGLLVDGLCGSAPSFLRTRAQSVLTKRFKNCPTRLTAVEANRCAAQLDDGLWGAANRYLLSLYGLPASEAVWREALEGRDFVQEKDPRIEHCVLAASEGTPLHRDALRAVLGKCVPSQISGLIKSIDPGVNPAMIPVWTQIARAGSVSIQTAFVGALRRIGHPAGEPFLLGLVNAETEPSMRGAALDALSEIGTPNALGTLYEWAEKGGGFGRRAQEVVAAIHDRHPVHAQGMEGGLSLPAAGSEKGALSLAAEAEVAQTRLYREAAAAVESAPAGPSTWGNPAWRRLAAPPRTLSWGVILTTFFVPSGWWTWFWWCVVALGVSGQDLTPLSWVGLVMALFGIYRSEGRRILRLLREGVPALALFKARERKAEHHQYTFVFLGENGTAYTFRHKTKKRAELIEDESREPVLYIPRGETFPEVHLFDAIDAIYLDDRGRIRARAGRVLLALLPILWFLVGGGLRLFR